jgi:hypothetical protein
MFVILFCKKRRTTDDETLANIVKQSTQKREKKRGKNLFEERDLCEVLVIKML